eukprot:g3535.t1
MAAGTIANRLEKGFARKGNAFRQTITPDAANCASICGDTIKGCVAINYRESDKVCLFLADPGYVEIAEGYTTALLNPSLNYICHSDNMILNYDRPGGDILGNPHSVSSATDCCVLCYTTPSEISLLCLLKDLYLLYIDCIAYAYVTGDRKCWLKSSVPQLKAKDIVMTGLVCPKASA